MSFDPAVPRPGTPPESAPVRDNFNALKAQADDLQSQINNIPAGPPGPKGDKGDPGESITGPQGEPGPAGADGRSINPRGEWNDAETYNRLDQVTHGGQLYQCNADGTTGATPGTDPRWDLVAINAPPAFPHEGDAQINGNTAVSGNLTAQGDVNAGAVGIGRSDIGGSGESGVIIRTDNSTGASLPLIAIRGSGADLFNIKLDFGGQTDGMGTPTVQDGAIYRLDLMTGTLKPWNVTVQTINYTDANGNPASMQVIVPPV